MAIELFELHGLNGRRYSLFSWRARMALAHKGLAFESRPVKVTDKAAIAFSGQTKVPIIRDGATIVSDSWKIAEHLERSYPARPSLFGGEGGHALARFVNAWADRQLVAAVVPCLMLDNVAAVEPDDAAHLRAGVEKASGRTLEELAAGREPSLKAFARLLDPLRATLRSQPFLCGAGPGYADYIVFSVLQWARVASATPVLPADDALAPWFERLLDAHDGLARAEPARR
ncbi:MAG TPA: glutathione S-transferase N-terminal domain-containing protein [Burkholderiales bacterium]|nr:glutathione S-transferase N-terminal domain-containing protein [Burkholderiales bacterium]